MLPRSWVTPTVRKLPPMGRDSTLGGRDWVTWVPHVPPRLPVPLDRPAPRGPLGFAVPLGFTVPVAESLLVALASLSLLLPLPPLPPLPPSLVGLV